MNVNKLNLHNTPCSGVYAFEPKSRYGHSIVRAIFAVTVSLVEML